MNTPLHLPPPGTPAYWAFKEQAVARAEELRRDAIGCALQRALSSLQEPLNWRKVRGSIG